MHPTCDAPFEYLCRGRPWRLVGSQNRLIQLALLQDTMGWCRVNLRNLDDDVLLAPSGCLLKRKSFP